MESLLSSRTIENSPDIIQTIKAMLTDPVYFSTPVNNTNVSQISAERICGEISYLSDSRKCLNLFYWRDDIWIFIGLECINDFIENMCAVRWVPFWFDL